MVALMGTSGKRRVWLPMVSWYSMISPFPERYELKTLIKIAFNGIILPLRTKIVNFVWLGLPAAVFPGRVDVGSLVGNLHRGK